MGQAGPYHRITGMKDIKPCLGVTRTHPRTDIIPLGKEIYPKIHGALPMMH